MLLATRCPLCRKVGPAPCGPCIDRMDPAPALAVPAGVDAAHALLRYEGAGRDLVAWLKYRNARSSVAWLAAGMAALVGQPPDVVTWVPTSAARRRQRGFDQARLLAVAVARRLGCPCRPLLRRDSTEAQTGRSREQRLSGPAFTALGTQFAPLRQIASPKCPASVVLVDDVVTTGASASAAALALRRAGAEKVVLVAAARTPPARRRSRA